MMSMRLRAVCAYIRILLLGQLEEVLLEFDSTACDGTVNKWLTHS
jgi:hypothetical protein